MEAITQWVLSHLKMVIFGGAALLLGVVLLISFVNIHNTGVSKENTLNGQYKINQNELSTCLTKIKDSSNLTKAEVAAMTEALTEAIKGRYDGRTPNAGAMFSAIVEDYPDLAQYDTAFQRAFVVIIGCRDDYKGAQNKLTDQIRDFDTWRQKWPTSWLTDTPSDRLRADSLRGEPALEQMRRLVLTQDALDAYNDGVLDYENPWEEETPK